MRKARVMAVAVIVVMLASLGTNASAATNNQHFTVVGTGQLEQLKVIASGVINTLGADNPLEDKEDPEAGTLTLRDEFVFPDGSLFVTASGPIRYSFDERTCIRSNTFHGTYRITGGTGAYAGFTGGGTYSGRLLFFEGGPEGCTDEGGHGVLVVRYRGTLAGAQAA